MAKKKYDPLWEVVDEAIPLQGTELDLQGRCPHCSVGVSMKNAKEGNRYECGLCGGVSEAVGEAGTLTLKRVS